MKRKKSESKREREIKREDGEVGYVYKDHKTLFPDKTPLQVYFVKNK
jgi:hypothetical protein